MIISHISRLYKFRVFSGNMQRYYLGDEHTFLNFWNVRIYNSFDQTYHNKIII